MRKIKRRKGKSYAITRRGSIHRQNTKTRLIKMRKVKNLITVTSLEQLHNIRKEKRITCERIKVRTSEGFDPFEIKLKLKSN